MNPLVAEIKAEYAAAEGWRKTTPLPADRVLAWMQSDDLEVLGALHRLLRYKGGLERIQPPLPFQAYYRFMTGYLRRCLCEYTEEAEPEWAEALHGGEATHEVVHWFRDLRKDPSVPCSVLHDLKAWVADTLLNCPQTQRLLATAIYDHLLSNRKIRRFFADWKADPQLRRFLE